MSHEHKWILVMFPEDGFVAAKCAHPDCEAYLSETEIEDILNLYPELLEALESIATIVTGSKSQMENQIKYARTRAKEAIKRARGE